MKLQQYYIHILITVELLVKKLIQRGETISTWDLSTSRHRMTDALAVLCTGRSLRFRALYDTTTVIDRRVAYYQTHNEKAAARKLTMIINLPIT